MQTPITDIEKMHYYRAFADKVSEIKKDITSPFTLASTADIPTLCRFYLFKDQLHELIHTSGPYIDLSNGKIVAPILNPVDSRFLFSKQDFLRFKSREMYAENVAQASLLFFSCFSLSSDDTFEIIARTLFLNHACVRFNNSKDVNKDPALTESSLRLYALIVFRSVFFNSKNIEDSSSRDWPTLLKMEPRWSLACPLSRWSEIKYLLSEPEYAYMESVHLNYGHLSPVMTANEYLEATWLAWPDTFPAYETAVMYDYF